MSDYTWCWDIKRSFMGFEWRRWKVLHDDSTQWSYRLTFWRLQLELFVYRHEYYDFPQYPPKRKKGSPDRWVIRPSIIYDRKRV